MSHNKYFQFVHEIRAALAAAQSHYMAPLAGAEMIHGEEIPAETLGDREQICHDELWSKVAHILAALILHDDDRSTLSYLVDAINERRGFRGLPPLRLGQTIRIPIVGTVGDGGIVDMDRGLL